MKLKNYFIMPCNRTYSLKEDYVLALILMNSDSKVSHISRSKLCQLAGIKKDDTISMMTKKFQEDGFITKVNNHTKKGNLVEYHINKPKHYLPIINSILQFKELGMFAIKLAEFRVNGTPCIYMSDNELIKAMHCGRSNYFKYKKQLIENKILIEDVDCYIISTEYFPVYKEISEQTEERINTLLGLDKETVGRKVFLHYYKQNFQNLNCSIDYFVNWCLAGCPGLKQKKSKEKIPDIEYNF